MARANTGTEHKIYVILIWTTREYFGLESGTNINSNLWVMNGERNGIHTFIEQKKKREKEMLNAHSSSLKVLSSNSLNWLC